MRFLLASWGSLGDLFPFLSLGRRLRERGHEVLLVGPEGWEEHAARAEVPFLAAAPDPGVLREVAELFSRRRWGTVSLEALVEKGAYVAMVPMAKTILSVASRFDCLVGHHFAFGAAAAAEACGIPWATVCLSPAALPSGELPPPAFPHLPLPFSFRRSLWKTAELWVSHRFDRGFNHLRKELGLPPAEGIFYRYSPGLVLHLYSSVLFGPARDWPPHHKLCGYCFYDMECSLPPELQEFVERGPAPWVFTLGSTMVARPGQFYEQALRAALEAKVRAVLLTGGSPVPGAPSDPNIMVLDQAPHSWLFPRSLVVTHCCGAGTLSKVLRAGRPSILCPCLFDQPIHAKLAAERGFGIALSPKQWKAHLFTKALQRVLSANLAVRVEQAARQLRDEDGPSRAAAFLEEFACSEKPSRGVQFGTTRGRQTLEVA